MKSFFKSLILLLVALVSFQCKKNETISEFHLEKQSTEVGVNQIVKIKILSGNGDYKIAFDQSSNPIAQATLSQDKQYFEIKGISEGQVTFTITDTKSETSKNIAVKVFVPIVPFELEKQSVEVGIDQNVKVNILSGNGDYEIISDRASVSIAVISLSQDKQYFEIMGIGKGQTTFTITDKKSQTSKNLSVQVIYSEILAEKQIPLYQAPNTLSIEQLRQKANEHYQQYLEIKTQIDKLPELPDNLYKQQKDAYTFSENHIKGLKSDYDNNQNDKAKVTKAYEEFFSYGIIFSKIELMARKAELFRLKFPNEARIEQIIRETFDGLYISQEGSDLNSGYNRDIVGNYNRIVEIVNTLNQQ